MLRLGALTAGAALAGLLPAALRNWLIAPLVLVANVELVRWLLDGAALRRTWTALLGVPALLLLLVGDSKLGLAFYGASVTLFLMLRRYRQYRELGSRRRAIVFAVAVVAFLLLVTLGGAAERGGWWLGGMENVASAGRWALGVFWFTSALHLFLGIRLHFLRLRPKLAFAGALVAGLPLLLMAALGVLVVFGTLGGNRSTQARGMLLEWRQLAVEDALGAGGPFADGFGRGEPVPSALAGVAGALARTRVDPFPSAVYALHEQDLWLVRVEPSGDRPRIVAGWRVTPATLDRIAARMNCRIDLHDRDSDLDLDIGASGPRTTGTAIGESDQRALRGFPRAGQREEFGQPTSFWTGWSAFGAAPLQVWKVAETGLVEENLVLALHVRPADVFGDLLDDENPVNKGIAVALLVLLGFFLLCMLLAAYFGLRIIGGITGAVGKLHGATERLARGDLDTWIDLPNEDEFGDLASSFNEMTSAIKVGQAQAIQKERMELELATARRIQQRLLPRQVPQLSGWEIAGSSDPTSEVGGDYFDFIELADGRLGVAVADVSGKGVPAALLMANLQAGLKGQVMHAQELGDLVARMNDLLSASTDTHMFATFVYAVVDPRTGRVSSVNAGHEPLLVVRASGEVEQWRGGGLILGMLPDQRYQEIQGQLDPGDVLVAYTDGITEAMGPLPDGSVPRLPSADDPDDEDEEFEVETNFFDEQRLVDVVVRHRERSAEEIRRALLEAVRRHVRHVPQSDDITLVVIKRRAA